MTKTTCDRCGKAVDPIPCGFSIIRPLRINAQTMAIDLCEDCQNKVKSFIFDQDKPAADKQTNLEWLKNRIQTMDAKEVSELIYPTGSHSFCRGRNCLGYTLGDCLICFRAWLEEEHNEL